MPLLRRLILKCLAVLGYLPNLFIWWVVGGPNWRRDHRATFLWFWHGGA